MSSVMAARPYLLLLALAIVAFAALALPGGTNAASLLQEVKMLLSPDASSNGFIGTTVGMSGDTVVAGATNEDVAGFNAGTAHVFVRDEGGANNWGHVKRLTASDAEADDRFGIAAIDGDTIVVGALDEESGGQDAGAAYIFQRDEGGVDNWGEVKKLLSSDIQAFDGFGSSVAIDGDTVVIGAFDEDSGGDDAGAAYVFQRDEGGVDNWGEVKKLTASDAGADDNFGRVAISGDTVIVAATGWDASGGSSEGAAYIFQQDEGGADNWGEVTRIGASDADQLDRFGSGLAIDGDTAAVGANDTGDVASNTGAGYVFERDEGGVDNWGEVTRLVPSETPNNARFGRTAAVDGDTVVMSGSNPPGTGFVFQRNEGGAGNWGEVTRLEPVGPALRYSDADIDGDFIILGSPETTAGVNRAGAAFIFDLQQPKPTATDTFTPTNTRTPQPPGTPTITPTPDGIGMLLRVDASQQIQCSAPAKGEVCVQQGAKFDIIIATHGIPADGYGLAQGVIDYDTNGLVQKPVADGVPPNASCTTGFTNPCSDWPDISSLTFLADAFGTTMQAGGLTGLLIQPPSNYEGDLYSFSMTCTAGPSTNTIILVPSNTSNTSGALYVDNARNSVIPKVSGIIVHCAVPPTPTATPTATNMPTSTPTATPPPIPRMSKCDQADNDGNTIKDSLEDENVNQDCNTLVNVFLTRQGAKIPSDTCLAGKGTNGNVAKLAEKISANIVSPDPKDPTSFQQLAAFEFEVHYDSTKVCVDLNVGASFAAAGAICIIEDYQPSSAPQLEGVARIGCVTPFKGHEIDELAPLADIDVYPQPDLYSGMKPNQDNGNVVHIANVNCGVADEQGHAIPIFSCDDADITFRYLEGDVEPDCAVDAIDAQAIAFRWGAGKGSLVYRDFMNLEPSGPRGDGDIDINDLQFVYGRFGSTCKNPHPAQDPVNPNG